MKTDGPFSLLSTLRAGRPGFDSRQSQGFLLFAIEFRPNLGLTQLSIQWVQGPLPRGINQLGREADHLPCSRADGKNTWSYSSNPPYAFMAWYLAKHRDKFTFK